MKSFCILFLCVLALTSCKKEVEVKEVLGPLEFYHPDGFPATVYPIDARPINREKFELGRDLFYSPILSSDNTISCASCHAQVHAFADHNVAFSIGVGGLEGRRNAPAIFNLAWQPSFMWDGGVNHLEIFPLAPITDHREMNETMENVVSKLNQHPGFKQKFKNAFGVDVISDHELFMALTQYMLMIVSDGSLYDDVKKGKAIFTTEQQAGYDLFLARCASCHQEPLFTDYSYRNNGLEIDPNDFGRYDITQNEQDKGKFKVPTLRNVLLTYPYMHDGRFFTIDQVLEHYSSGIANHLQVDASLLGLTPLNPIDKKNLKRFLETLVDYKLLENPLLREP